MPECVWEKHPPILSHVFCANQIPDVTPPQTFAMYFCRKGLRLRKNFMKLVIATLLYLYNITSNM